MKKSVQLKVLSDYSIKKGHILVEPNDGFDLGLMSTTYSVNVTSIPKLASGKELDLDLIQKEGENMPLTLCLANECKHGTIQLDPDYWKSIGKPNTAILYYDNGLLVIEKTS